MVVMERIDHRIKHELKCHKCGQVVIRNNNRKVSICFDCRRLRNIASSMKSWLRIKNEKANKKT